MRPPLHNLFAAAVVLALVALPAAGQDAPLQPGEATAEAAEGDDGLYFEVVDVNVVNVDVYVTDKKGNPVTGLTADDFEVFENGRPVKVSNFYAVQGGRPLNLPERAPEIAEAPRRPDDGPLEMIPEDQRLNLVIYIDNFNIRPFNRNRVFRRLREFLHDHVGREDRVMLVSYDRSLHIRHPFTTDSSLISNSLYDLEDLTGHGVHHDSERLEMLRLLEESGSVGEVQWRVRQFAESGYNDLMFTIDALRDLITSLGGLDGRKALLYVSDGLQMTVAEDLYLGMIQKFGVTSVMSSLNEFRATSKFEQLAAQANANRIVFYTIDASGLRVATHATAEVGIAGQPGLSSFVDSVYTTNLQSPLLYLAERTGGRAIINTNDVGDGLDRIAADFGTYYSLGYVPAHSGDGRYYKIEVKVKDEKRLDVRHRQGYRDKSIYSRMSDGTTSTLLYGYYQNPMDIELKFGYSEAVDGGHFNVPIEVQIPLGKVTLIEREQHHVARLKLFFSALDDQDRRAEVSEVPLDIRIPNEQVEQALGQNYVYQVNLRMRRGGQRVAVGVRDELGATESYVTRSVNIGSG